jgi:DNA-binding transcriptional ArsR family regulator
MDGDSLSLTFAALADPTRRAILHQLLAGEAAVGELAEPFQISTRAISKHVAVLEAAGLVTRVRDRQRRPSRIRLEPLAKVDEWLSAYRNRWEARFDRIDQNLARIQTKGETE